MAGLSNLKRTVLPHRLSVYGKTAVLWVVFWTDTVAPSVVYLGKNACPWVVCSWKDIAVSSVGYLGKDTAVPSIVWKGHCCSQGFFTGIPVVLSGYARTAVLRALLCRQSKLRFPLLQTACSLLASSIANVGISTKF